jgi:hypothetical protein
VPFFIDCERTWQSSSPSAALKNGVKVIVAVMVGVRVGTCVKVAVSVAVVTAAVSVAAAAEGCAAPVAMAAGLGVGDPGAAAGATDTLQPTSKMVSTPKNLAKRLWAMWVSPLLKSLDVV